ncbi:hypothetical protein [Edaphobacillus lindanitolerans]|uniref:Uncharacterized protein n=1 Tax=Edaphobacillus lindanitolerans TaxID=550447 RepID=A0A1U7PIC7_9BACI|nr:hypothetical protein [Edaphobacillus lindanitolerans]SIT73032.1 hypothetical protein SAMN05428946_0931 [Edaphobacillus lindanitolerans]
MELPRISLMDAYLIETLRSNGISDEEILAQARQGDTDNWRELNARFDFSELAMLAEQNLKGFQAILSLGYRVKFVTFKGLQNLLRLRYGIEPGTDYELMETGIRDLVLDQEQLAGMEQMLSENWMIARVGYGDEIRVDISAVV